MCWRETGSRVVELVMTNCDHHNESKTRNILINYEENATRWHGVIPGGHQHRCWYAYNPIKCKTCDKKNFLGNTIQFIINRPFNIAWYKVLLPT